MTENFIVYVLNVSKVNLSKIPVFSKFLQVIKIARNERDLFSPFFNVFIEFNRA